MNQTDDSKKINSHTNTSYVNNSHLNKRTGLTLVWGMLISLTLFSTLVAEQVSPNALIIILICAVISIKGWLVIDHLMGLKHANPMLRWSVHSYFFIMPPILAVIVIFPEWVAKVTTL